MVVAVFLIAVAKSPQEPVKEERVYFDSQVLGTLFIHGREGTQQEHEVPGHITFTVGKQRENASVLLIFI